MSVSSKIGPNLCYSTGLGVPEARYIAPANSADCIQVKAGDCAPRSVLLLTPWFNRVDLGVMKKIGIGGTRSVELRFDFLNVFDTPRTTTGWCGGDEHSC